MEVIQIIIFCAYIAFIWAKFGVQYSISATFYTLDYWKKNTGWVFTGWVWLWLWMLWPTAIEFAQDGNVWLILAILLESFLAAAAAFRDDPITRNVHNISSYAGILVGQIGISIYLDLYWWVYPACFLAVGAIMKFGGLKNFIWWAEIVAFFSIFIPLLTRG